MLTSFVGRAGAVREVAGLLEEYRLVTVTRLASEVARGAQLYTSIRTVRSHPASWLL